MIIVTRFYYLEFCGYQRMKQKEHRVRLCHTIFFRQLACVQRTYVEIFRSRN